MSETSKQLAGCQREIQDCEALLKATLNDGDRATIQQRLKHAQEQLRQLEDEILLGLME